MKNTILGFLVAGALVAIPFAASAQSLDLQAQINVLLEQIKTLQLKIADLVKQQSVVPPPTPLSSNFRICALLNRNLSQGSSGDDVTGLQEFLNTQGFLSANATGFFGPLTAQAVAKWQSSEGVSSVGSIGPASREHIRIWCGNPNPSPSQNFSAVPTSGAAPLAVTFTTSVGVGDTDPSIDFGDGQQGTMTRGSCIGIAAIAGGQGGIRCSDTSTHTYSSNGTFTAVLTSKVDLCGGTVGCMAPMSIRVLGKVQITVGDTSTTCKPIAYMPVLCDGGSAAQPVHDSNGCLIKYECPVVNFTPPASCKAWNDGCNTCSRTSPTSPAMCTMRACLMTTVTDSVGGAGSTQNIWAGKGYCTAYFDDTAGNKPPVISSFSGPTTLALNAAGTWSVQASDPQNGQLTYQIAWGDESNTMNSLGGSAMPAVQFVQSTTFTHAYSVAGIYNVKINVSGSGGVSSASATVQVGTQNNSSQFSASPTSGSAPLPVSFWYILGGDSSKLYSIDFGDGASATPTIGCGTAPNSMVGACPRALTASHTYTVAGTYTATLTQNGLPLCFGCQPPVLGTVTIKVQTGGGTVCTQEYAPVCAQPPEPACRHATPACMIATPGPTTYSNRCMMNAAGATFISDGACTIGGVTSCPTYPMPQCTNGTVVAGPIGASGCASAPVCRTFTGSAGGN